MRERHRLASPVLLLLSGLAAVAPAQEPATTLLTLEVAGPAGLRQAFLATNFGTMVSGDESKKVWEAFFAQWAGVFGDPDEANQDATYAAFHELVKGYDGRFRLRVFRLRAAPARQRGMGAVVEFLPDGRTDLDALARGLRRLLLGAIKGEAKTQRVGELDVPLLTPGREISLPMVHRKRVVMFFSGEIELAIRVGDGLLAQEPEPAPATRCLDPIRLSVDVPAWIENYDFGGGGRFLEAFYGLSAIRGLDIRVKPVGPHVRLDVELSVTDEFRGLLACLVGEPGRLPDLSALPRGEPYWSAFPMSWNSLWAIVTAIEFKGDIDDAVGFDVKSELIDNLRPGLLLLGDDPEKWCIGFNVKDGDAVAGAMDKLMTGFIAQGSRGRVEPAEEDYKGVTIRTLQLPFDRNGYTAVHSGRYLLAFGSKGRERLRKVIDTGLARKTKAEAKDEAKPKPRRLPAAIRRTRSSMPPGCNGMGVLAAKRIHKAVLPMLVGELSTFLRRGVLKAAPSRALLPPLRQLGPLFKKYRLDQAVWYTGREKDRLHIRFVW